jgi:hypothetical protein
MSSIPASAIVSVNPNVLSAGGAQLELNAIFITDSTAVPMGTVMPFSSQADVADFFGSTSDEANLATKYFNGYSISTSKPGRLYFAQYARAAVAAYLRGGSMAAVALADIKALSGTLTITVDEETHTTASIDLAAATSQSNAASIIQTALRASFTADITCTYDAQLSAFVITSATTGNDSIITFASGTLAAGIKLTSATGAVTSQGSDISTPVAFMDGIKAVTQNWASFMTIFEPTDANKELFAEWTNSQNNRFAYVAWDSSADAIVANSTNCFGAVLALNDYSGTALVYNDFEHAAFACGVAASIDFTQLNNRPTWAFKGQSGLTPSVTDETTGDNLIGNGYNFYGNYATSAQEFNFFYPGQISGAFQWMDSYFNQIWMNARFQSDLMTLLQSVPSIPYNTYGYQGLIATSLQDAIAAAVNYGAIRVGIRPTSTQAAAVNNAAGVDITNTLFAQGWYLQVKDPGGPARQARQSPVINFWYMDGQSVQKINLTSTLLQ